MPITAFPDPTKHLQGYGRRDPETGMLRGLIHFPDGSPPDPSACRWCGQPQGTHGQWWRPGKGYHQYETPTQAQMKARMVARRNARLNAPPTQYHALPDWTGDGTPEGEGDDICADCRTKCSQYIRTYWRRIVRHDRYLTSIGLPPVDRTPF